MHLKLLLRGGNVKSDEDSSIQSEIVAMARHDRVSAYAQI
jgi:hypothetical protein